MIFGTKLPSMTSRCTHSAPDDSMRFTAAAMLEKSAERIEGAMRIFSFFIPIVISEKNTVSNRLKESCFYSIFIEDVFIS